MMQAGHNLPVYLGGYSTVFQITFNGRVSTRSFEGSIDVSLPTSSQVYNLSGQVASFLGFLT